MHDGRVVAFDEVWFVAVAGQQRLQFFMRYASKDGGVGDLVAVEVQHWEDGSVANRIKKLVGVPGGRQRTGLRLAIADYHCDDEIRIIERRSVAVRDSSWRASPALHDQGPRCT